MVYNTKLVQPMQHKTRLWCDRVCYGVSIYAKTCLCIHAMVVWLCMLLCGRLCYGLVVYWLCMLWCGYVGYSVAIYAMVWICML